MKSLILKLLLIAIVTTGCVTQKLSESNATLDRVMNKYRADCLRNVFEGDVPSDITVNKNKYFYAPEEAIEKLIISKGGQTAYVVYAGEFSCTGQPVGAGYCGSRGCSYDIIVNDKVYGNAGYGRPILVEAFDALVMLQKRSGWMCKANKHMDCVQALVWDEEEQELSTMGW